jgi:hypothetical protein
MSGQRRHAVLPLGRSWPEADEEILLSIEDILESCDANTNFIIEPLQGDRIEAFSEEYADVLRQRQDDEYVVGLCGVQSLGTLLGAWGRLVGDFPFFVRALWVVFVRDDQPRGDAFCRKLRSLGEFDGLLSEREDLLVWRPSVLRNASFLLVRTRVWDLDAVQLYSRKHFSTVERNTIPAPPSLSPSPRPPASSSLSGASSSGLRLRIPHTKKSGDGQ